MRQFRLARHAVQRPDATVLRTILGEINLQRFSNTRQFGPRKSWGRHRRLQLGYSRITAGIFVGNTGSARVLEKAGFILEAPLLRKCYRKDGRFIDAILYAKVREE